MINALAHAALSWSLEFTHSGNSIYLHFLVEIGCLLSGDKRLQELNHGIARQG